ncbi:G-protein coupled receptor Mth2-like [Formica exsecta]|uniref:G-protein coupled receptor Mth2-like n=1 Tax=Formica exsecta TaxID=72781 RepID=UPI001142C488|nr:G-protein coupled receptor Mth2-like [Formica exsecta]
MCRKNLVFWYCTLFLLVAMSSKTQQNFTGNEEKNDHLTIQYEIDGDSTTNYGDEIKIRLFDLYEKTTNNTQYEDVQYKSRTVSTSNDRENDDWKQFIFIQEFYENLMRIEDKNNSMINMSHKFGNFSKDNNTSCIIPDETSYNIICIQLCCPLGYRLNEDECILEKNKYIFPNVYEYMNDSLQTINKTVDELFQLAVYDPCQDQHFMLYDDEYMFFANGSLYLSTIKIFANSTSYCLAMHEDKYEVTICLESLKSCILESFYIEYDIYNYVENHETLRVNYYIVSILLLMSIFVVYSILPELRNEHGFMLRNYSGALSVAYITDFIPILIEAYHIHPSACFIVAFLKYFFFFTTFFWLNIMSFDMWWTFKGFSSLQRNVKQRKRKKLVFYSIFAWSLSFILAIISFMMDITSNMNLYFVIEDCEFTEMVVFTPYYYGFQSICIISSICLSISTALKISRYENETGNRLANSESRKYNDNKKWSNLYLKLFILLFILMGIKWSMMTIMWLYKYLSLSEQLLIFKYANYFINVIVLTDIMQNVCTFIVFVLKKKIMRMLLKRFGCGFRCAINATSPSTESTYTITLEEMPMQKKMSSCEQRICYEKDSSCETKL